MLKNEVPYVIRTGQKILLLVLGNFKFIDCVNFTAGGSLSSFCKDWNVTEPKGLFPYDLFRSPEELYACKTFPSYESFNSSLGNPDFVENLRIFNELSHVQKNALLEENIELNFEKLHTNPELYLSKKAEFNTKMRSGEYTSFVDYLKIYNNQDVIILTEAFSRYISAFMINYEENPLNCVRLGELITWVTFF